MKEIGKNEAARGGFLARSDWGQRPVGRVKKMVVNMKLVMWLEVVLCILLLHCENPIGCDSAPRITIQPNDLVAVEGESSELNCDAEGQPEPSIEWYHNGQLIKTSTHSRTTMGGSIQFLDIRRSAGNPSDTGTYYCLARNSLGQAKSRNASLQVAYIKEDFKLSPEDKLASLGDLATFDCLPEAWPEPSIKWRKDGHLLELSTEWRLSDGSAKYSIERIANTHLNITLNSELQQDLFGSRLTIRQLNKSDAGSYSCLVETRGSHRLIERQSKAGQLQVFVKPYFIEAPAHQSAQMGAQVRLRCRMAGEPDPVVSWRRHNGQPLSEKTQIDPIDKTLILDHLSAADQGTYICEGENSVGSARSLATVSVNSRPKFIVQPEDQEVDLGARVQIKCSGEASPQPLLFWYKEGHRQLMFAPGASPALPSTQSSLPKLPFTDWPQAAPLVAAPDYRFGAMSSTGDTSPSINKLFTMPISADSLPPGGGGAYSNSYFGNRIYVDNQGTLNIVNVTSSDSGYYACALISSVGSVMAKSKLTIRSSPSSQLGISDYYHSPQDSLHSRNSIINNNKFDLLPPPVIKLGAANQTLPTNTSAILVCEVVSQVAYKIQWFFDAQPIQEEPNRVMVLDSGALGINNLRTTDSGIYTCVVTAATDQMMPLAGSFEPLDSSMLTSAPPIQQSTSHSTMLKVASPMNPNIQFYRMDTFAYPSSPGAAYLVSTNGNDAITIAWTPPADSGTLPIKEYVVEHYDTSQEHIGWRIIYRIKGKESLLIDGLSPDGSHFFVIRAANSHGTGPSSAIAGPMRTVAGEARYQSELNRRRDPKRVGFDSSSLRPNVNHARDRLMTISTNLLSLTPVSSTSIRLQWMTQVAGNLTTMAIDTALEPSFPPLSTTGIEDYLEGYSIRYRPIGIGESLLSKDPLVGANWNSWPLKDTPSSLPLVTSYLNSEEEESLIRTKRDTMNYFDYSQEFNEVRVVDYNTEHFTINGLRPFTLYQFFVVPYYKDIDGVPSNILSAQTNEDRPSVAPASFTVRPINNTTVRLLWLHVPPAYANGILRGYVARINRSDIPIGQSEQQTSQTFQQSFVEPPRLQNLPLATLNVAPLSSFSSDSRIQQSINNIQQQYVVMYDLTNLTHKSFYSVQVAASTSVGPGPWTDSQNFIMDFKTLSQQRMSGSEFDDIMSKSLILINSRGLGNALSSGFQNIYYMAPVAFIILAVIIVGGFMLYRRNDQKVITWKKTISEHFNNKFYMPSAVEHRGPNSIQQNIYDHQQHLIYSGSTHISQTTLPPQNLWGNNGCLASSGTESLSSHGGLIPINNDPNNVGRRLIGDQIHLMNNKDVNPRMVKNNTNQIISHQGQVKGHSADYYSVINNMAEYEELDQQQRLAPTMAIVDRHQTGSSNSDTSCPSSVTRLLPNPTYNREFVSKTFGENPRHEMVLQQQIGCNDGKPLFTTMINNDSARMQSMMPLSPYATTNLMNHAPQQALFSNPQMGMMVDHSRQQNSFPIHGAGITMDDSSKILMNQQQQLNHSNNPNPTSVFRTLQRNPVSFQSRGQQQFSQTQPQIFMQTESSNGTRFNNQNFNSNHFQTPTSTNITLNPLNEMKANLYEHIDYADSLHQGTQFQHQTSNEIVSSSTSNNSMKSSSQHSPDQHQLAQHSKFKKASLNGNFDEAHDLRVFSSHSDSRQLDSISGEEQRLNGESRKGAEEDCGQGAEESTPLRQGDTQRTRQLSKRKRQQQRNRLHNNNQKIDQI